MSAIQSAAIKAWWSARKAAGWVKPKISDDERRRREREAHAKKRAENPTAMNAIAMTSYYANHEHNKAKRRQQYAERAEQHRANDKARRMAQRERFSELGRARYERTKDRRRAENAAWRSKNREKLRANARKRDALKAQTSVGPVDYVAILTSANGICGICRGAVDTSDPKAYHFDHIVPLSRGGGHVQENIQLAHAKCNMRKHARVA
jgi:5-methylcytosine-specific restriction endonuclease McrA